METRDRTVGTTVALAIAALTLAGCEAATEPLGPPGEVPAPPGPEFAVIVQDLTDLGTLGGSTGFAFNEALGINDLGQIVGRSETASGDTHAFLWEGGVGMVDLGTLGGDFALASGINDLGQVVGRSEAFGGDTHAFLWENGAMVDVGTLGGISSNASAINSLGQVVGASLTASGDTHAFLWENGVGMVDLATLGGGFAVARGINDLGQVVGQSTTASGRTRAFLWEDGVGMMDLGTLGGADASAQGNNDAGQVVGLSQTASGDVHAFLWEDGVGMVDLGTLGGGFSAALGINDLGQVVGESRTASGSVHAFVWQDGVMYDLGTLAGGSSSAQDIDNNGGVVGQSFGAVSAPVRWIVPIAASVEIEASKGNAHEGTIALTGPDRITAVVHGNPWFDAAEVDPATVTLGNEDGNDTGVTIKRNGDLRAGLVDVDRDGHTDLALEFSRDAMLANGDLSSSTQQLLLLGDRFDGRRIRGAAVVNVVP